jgi:putative NIF3 family GTP cyclohydrolase 1 type 2
MITIQAVIDKILAAIPRSMTKDTVDTIKAGNPSQPVNGIITTFLASQAVLQKAVELGANFVITHEPTFYNHLDNVDWLVDDPIYQTKRDFIMDHHLVVWRFHDNLHTNQPDPTFAGITAALGWEGYVDPTNAALFNLPSVSLKDLTRTIKDRLGIRTLRVIGRPEITCQKAGILVGAWGGTNQMLTWKKADLDVLIVGETPEWETVEYARDAMIQGRNKALIITGHANSEEPGMHWLVNWLQEKFPEIPIHHVPVGDPFEFV